MSKNILNKYIWLIETIGRSGSSGITFEGIQEAWSRSILNEENTEYSKRTFHHQKTEIENTLSISISCNRRTNCYSIQNNPKTAQNDLRSWLYNTFLVSNILRESDHIRERILVDESAPSQEFLLDIIRAMSDNHVINLRYHPFTSSHILEISLAPYFIKMHQRRWYVYGYCNDKLKVYALDRINALNITNTPFNIPKDFDAAEYLKNTIGVSMYEHVPPCEITIKVYGVEVRYIETLPIHTSQELIESCEDFTIFRYYLCPTEEFYSEIMRRGRAIEILTPHSVRNEFITRISSILKPYLKPKKISYVLRQNNIGSI